MRTEPLFTWYCVHTHPNKERVAEKHLVQQNYAVFAPTIVARKIERPLFPRYIFVCVSKNQNWSPIRYTEGVSYILTKVAEDNYQIPASVRIEQVVHALKNYATQDDSRNWRIQPNTRVRVTNGIWKNHEALCQWTDGTRAKLLFQLLGSPTSVTFSVTDLEPINGHPSPPTAPESSVSAEEDSRADAA